MKPRVSHLVAVALVAVLARALFFLLEMRTDELFLRPLVDEGSYLADAQRLVRAGFASDALALPFWQPPGYVFAVAALTSLGAGVPAIVLVQQALGAANALLVFLLASAYGGGRHPRVALAAGVAYSLCPAILYYETKLLKPTWNIALLLIVMGLARRRPTRRTLVANGLVIGLLCLFEAYFLLLALGLCAGYARRVRFDAALFAAAAALVILPVATLNTRAAGRPVLISANGGINLFLGNNPDWIRTYNLLPGWDWERLTLRFEEVHGLTGNAGGAASSPLFTREVLAYAGASPVDYAAGLATKAGLVLSARELTRDNFWSFPAPLEAWSYLVNGLVVVLAFLCLPALPKRGPPLALGILVIVAVNVLFFPSTRYRLPAIPLVLVSCFVLPELAWTRRRALLAGAGILATSGAALLATRVLDYDGWRSMRYLEIGRALTEARSLGPAKLYFERALDTHASLETLVQLALFRLYAQKDENDALSLFERAAEHEPAFPDTYFHLGVLAERRGDADAAYELHHRYVTLRDAARFETASTAQLMKRALRFMLAYQREHGFERRAERTARRLRTLEKNPDREAGS